MKLNMGCGYNKLPGWVNVDLFPECDPDLVLDLESLPWPWADDSVEQVRFFHSLEHMGRDTGKFLGIVKELYRVCTDGAPIEIAVPHPRSDDFINDPTHVRIITPGLLSLLDREVCDDVVRRGGSNSPLAHYLHVDFAISDTKAVLEEPYFTQYNEKRLSSADIERMGREMNNVIAEYHITMAVRKRPPPAARSPARRSAD
jgi:hypothetical protein